MTTRSTVLAAGTLVGRLAGTVYQGPVGFTTIVKTVYLYTDQPTADQVYFSVVRDSPAANAPIFVKAPDSNGLINWEGWLVLWPFDKLQFGWTSGSIYYWISGAKLPGTA